MRDMNQSARQTEILRLLHIQRLCSVTELSDSFGVSEETIRRDIRQLEELGEAIKVHGGVRLPDNIYETPFLTRMKEQEEAKRLIAATAAGLIPNGASLFIDSGTTSVWTAQTLATRLNLTVVTDSIEAARAMTGQSNTRVYLAGGEINPDYAATFGPTANEYVEQFTTDTAILSIGGIHAQHGLQDFHMGESEIKRIALRRASRVIIVADATKFDRVGLIKTAGFDEIDVLVTDSPPPDELRDVMPNVEIVVATQPGSALLTLQGAPA